MSCHRCLADPQPKHFGSPRKCAFTADGQFTPDNWNCATLALLCSDEPEYGEDESMNHLWVGGHDTIPGSGWLILTRYKTRGCCSSAVRVGDFFPPEPLTFAQAEQIIAYHHAEVEP